MSNDGGQTWTCGGGEPGVTTGGYEWVFSRLWVDPANENHLFEANVEMRESADGGNTWINNTSWSSARVQPASFSLDTLHADQHAMAWDPNVPKRVYVGNDGGAYRSDTNGDQPDGSLPTSSLATKRNYLHGTIEPWTQPYHVSVSQQDAKRLVIGLQDNGSSRTWTPGVEPTDLTVWNQYGGGDGFEVQIDPTNQLRYYECLQPSPPSINCARRTDTAATGATTSTNSNFSTPPWPANERIEVAMPMVIDPADPGVVYVGGTGIARSGQGVVSGTGAWTLISNADPGRPGEPARRRAGSGDQPRHLLQERVRRRDGRSRRPRRPARRPRRPARSTPAPTPACCGRRPTPPPRPLPACSGRSWAPGCCPARGSPRSPSTRPTPTTSTSRSPATRRATGRPTSGRPPTAARPGRTSRPTSRTPRSGTCCMTRRTASCTRARTWACSRAPTTARTGST